MVGILSTEFGFLYTENVNQYEQDYLHKVSDNHEIIPLLKYSKEGDEELLKKAGFDMFWGILASRKDKIDAENEKNRRRKFVFDRFSSIEDSVVDKIYKDMCNADFQKLSGFYVQGNQIFGAPKITGSKDYFNEGMEYDYKKSPAQNFSLLKESISATGHTYETFRRYQTVRYAVNGLHKSKAFHNPKGISLSGNISQRNAIGLVMLLKRPDTFDVKYSEVEEVAKNLGTNSWDPDSFNISVESISVRRFKNGRVDISGLSPSEENELMSFLKIKRKLFASSQEF